MNHGPVTIQPPEYNFGYDPGTPFVWLSDGYYRRIPHNYENNDSVTYDVEPLSAQELLHSAAHNITRGPSEIDFERRDWRVRLVVTGDTVTSLKSPAAEDESSGFLNHVRDNLGKESLDPDNPDEVGGVYHYNGTFYTTVVTRDTISRPGISTDNRALLVFVGIGLLVLAIARRSEYRR